MRTFIQAVVSCVAAGCLFPATATTYFVAAGESLQAALNSALPGDTITIQAGATFTGNFVLPNKGGTGTITIQSSAIGSLPVGRVTPADAVNMPKLVTHNGAAALAAAAGAHDYVITGLELTVTPKIYVWTIVQLGVGDEKTADVLPYNITVDRCYVHGDPAVGAKRGVGLNSRSTSLLNSWVSDIKSNFQDSQAAGGINGPGPFKIINNYLEASGENIMFGGATPGIPNLVPSDITIQKNTLRKPLAWKSGEPGFQGTTWVVKNLFELKNARRVYFDGNLLENSWAGGQGGAAIVLTVRTEDGKAPWAVVEDVYITNNIIRHVGVGITAHGHDTNGGVGQRYTVKNNIFEDINPARWGGSGSFMVLSGPVSGIVVEHNTMFPPTFAIFFGSVVSPGVVYRNNISTAPICADSKGCGANVTQASGAGAVFEGNLMVGLAAALGPLGNLFPAAISSVIFTDMAASDYALAPGSPYRNTGTDGKDPGVDMVALKAAMDTGSVAAEVTLVISPLTATLTQNQTQQFASTVAGTTNEGVNWTVSPAIGTLSASGLYSAPSSITSTQTVTITARSIADPTKTAVASVTLNPPPPPATTPPSQGGAGGAGGTAQFLGTDAATSGTWKGKYGSEGAFITNDAAVNPSYATVSITGATPHTWSASTTDTRALQKGNSTERIASTWFSTTSFVINVNITDGKSHRISLYCMDYTMYRRQQTIDIADAATGAVLSSQPLANFGTGKYLTWQISGRVTIRVSNNGVVNGIVSGIFFDPIAGSVTPPVPPPAPTPVPPPPPAPASSASFVSADWTTGGSWKDVYGSEGYSIAGNSAVYPSYATVSITGATPIVWASTSYHPRDPEKGDAGERIASAWSSSTSFDIKVNLKDGKPHRIRLYCLDWSLAGASQSIDIIDAGTGALLNRQTVSNFWGGVYLAWDVTGNVIIRVKSTGTADAVVSALFFK